MRLPLKIRKFICSKVGHKDNDVRVGFTEFTDMKTFKVINKYRRAQIYCSRCGKLLSEMDLDGYVGKLH